MRSKTRNGTERTPNRRPFAGVDAGIPPGQRGFGVGSGFRGVGRGAAGGAAGAEGDGAARDKSGVVVR